MRRTRLAAAFALLVPACNGAPPAQDPTAATSTALAPAETSAPPPSAEPIAPPAPDAEDLPVGEPAPMIYTAPAPPPPRYEPVMTAGPDRVWVGGYWDWDGSRWTWIQGHLVRARPGHAYAPPRYVNDGGRVQLYRPHWRAENGPPPVATYGTSVPPPPPPPPPPPENGQSAGTREECGALPREARLACRLCVAKQPGMRYYPQNPPGDRCLPPRALP